MLPALALSIALSATSVPPGTPVDSPIQPTVQVFARKPVDEYRKANWLRYNAELETHWQAYRAAGSTPAAWQTYLTNAEAAKFRYLRADPYLLPVVEPPLGYLPPWEQVIQDAALSAGAGCTP